MKQELEKLLQAQPEPLFSAKNLFPDIDPNRIGIQSGKVRDSFFLRNNHILMVATDRISTFDAVHPNQIPGKGIILTQLTKQWFELLKEIPNHFLTDQLQNFPAIFKHESRLIGRTMLVQKLDMIPVECVIRGYLSGSAWASYQKGEPICGISLPAGLLESQQLDEPIFTPSTKANTGHDEPLIFEQLCQIIGTDLAQQLRKISLAVYSQAYKYASSRGIIIADTKLEFGLSKDGRVVLGDEVLTPDSSRFWDLEKYQPGKSQPSFDKQPVRDWARSTGWNLTPPAPALPEEVILQTQQRYKEAYFRLFG